MTSSQLHSCDDHCGTNHTVKLTNKEVRPVSVSTFHERSQKKQMQRYRVGFCFVLCKVSGESVSGWKLLAFETPFRILEASLR